MFKAAVKRMLYWVGLEPVRKEGSAQQFPPWMITDSVLTREELNKGADFEENVLVNRTLRPARPRYRRTQYGDDHRLKYMLYFLDVRDQRVLELGPFHGTHSFILEKLGVRETVSVEARQENLLHCRKLKDLYGLERTTFVLQDIEKLYRREESPLFSPPFDLVFCCGLLYHLPEPAWALQWLRTQAPNLFLATYYVENDELWRYPQPAFQFGRPWTFAGHTYTGAWFREGGKNDPPSGMSPVSFWPYEADLIAMVKHAGYSRISVLGKDLLNNAPHITLLAEA
jgi:hypothetical protein